MGAPAARGAQQFSKDGYHGRIVNPRRQPLPDSGPARVFRAGVTDCCPFRRAQQRARRAARFPPVRPIGGHLFRIRFLTGLVCRWASPPPGRLGGHPSSPSLTCFDLDTVRDRPRPRRECPVLRVQTRARHGRTMDERRSPRDRRSRRTSGGPESTVGRSDRAGHTRPRTGNRSRACSDPGGVLARSAIVRSRSRAYPSGHASQRSVRYP